MDQSFACSVQGNLFKSERWVQFNKVFFIHKGLFVWLDLYGKKDHLLSRITMYQSDIDKIQELLNKIICYV